MEVGGLAAQTSAHIGYLSAICTNVSFSSFSKELKKALVQASKEDVAHDGLLVILNHGLESLTEIPHSPRRIDKWLEKLSAYSKVYHIIFGAF